MTLPRKTLVSVEDTPKFFFKNNIKSAASYSVIIHIYDADAGSWRSLFAVHTWIAVKPENAKPYTVLTLSVV